LSCFALEAPIKMIGFVNYFENCSLREYGAEFFNRAKHVLITTYSQQRMIDSRNKFHSERRYGGRNRHKRWYARVYHARCKPHHSSVRVTNYRHPVGIDFFDVPKVLDHKSHILLVTVRAGRATAAAPHTSEIKPQSGQSRFRKRSLHAADDIVVHITSVLGVWVAYNRSTARAARWDENGGLEFETGSRNKEVLFRHG